MKREHFNLPGLLKHQKMWARSLWKQNLISKSHFVLLRQSMATPGYPAFWVSLVVLSPQTGSILDPLQWAYRLKKQMVFPPWTHSLNLVPFRTGPRVVTSILVSQFYRFLSLWTFWWLSQWDQTIWRIRCWELPNVPLTHILTAIYSVSAVKWSQLLECVVHHVLGWTALCRTDFTVLVKCNKLLSISFSLLNLIGICFPFP